MLNLLGLESKLIFSSLVFEKKYKVDTSGMAILKIMMSEQYATGQWALATRMKLEFGVN